MVHCDDQPCQYLHLSSLPEHDLTWCYLPRGPRTVHPPMDYLAHVRHGVSADAGLREFLIRRLELTKDYTGIEMYVPRERFHS